MTTATAPIGNFKTRPSRFLLTDSEGRRFRWTFYRDSGYGCWVLRTHDGCVRLLESNWVDSVPLIRLIAENYGLTTRIG